ncbi:MAG: LLM class flavin-dependent oxidoreductase [Candidatus Dormibacteria bacterium]
MHRGLFVPPFGEASDPHFLASLAAEAEDAGWDGIFLWDHLRYADVSEILDPWIGLAAIASATKRIRFGQMVTPLARRRPWIVARQAAALDVLSHGRMILGVGLGDIKGGEFAAFGEELDIPARARKFDEALELIPPLLAGATVERLAGNYHIARTAFRPAAVQRPLPIWVAARWPNRAPLRRAARHQGAFVIQLDDASELIQLNETLAAFRATRGPFDIVLAVPPGTDAEPWERGGATWLLTRFDPHRLRRREIHALVVSGPG